MRTLLFDIDGTLLRGHGEGLRAMERAGREVVGQDFNLTEVSFAGALDTDLFAEGARRAGAVDPGALEPAFRARYLQLLAQALDGQARPDHGPGGKDGKPQILPGVAEVLEAVARQSGWKAGLVTGNYPPSAMLKLKAAGIDAALFGFGGFAGDAPDRAGLVRTALERAAALEGRAPDPDTTLVIGDTPRDVACAHANGLRCICVATGHFRTQQLRDAGADHVLASMEPSQEILAILAGPLKPGSN